MLPNARGRLLWLATPIAAGVSGLSLVAALCGEQWIQMEERVLNPNLTALSFKREFIVKKTYAGLFNICETNPGGVYFKCSRIDLLPDDVYISDLNNTSQSIPRAVVQSIAFFFMAVTLLVFAEILLLLGYFQRTKRFLLLISGLFFIVSGLVVMLGLVVFIATLKGHIADKLRPESTYEPPLLDYDYGWSFFLVLTGFVSEEMSGILAFYFYIYWHEHDWFLKTKKSQSQEESDPQMCLKAFSPRNSRLEYMKRWKPVLTSSFSLPSLPITRALHDDADVYMKSDPHSSKSTSTTTTTTFISPKFVNESNDFGRHPNDFHQDWEPQPQVNKVLPKQILINNSENSHKAPVNPFSGELPYLQIVPEYESCKLCELNSRANSKPYPSKAEIGGKPEFSSLRRPTDHRPRVKFAFNADYDCWCSASYYHSDLNCCEYCCNPPYDCCSCEAILRENKPKLISKDERYITI